MPTHDRNTDANADMSQHAVQGLLHELRTLAQDRNKVCVGDIADRIGKRSYGPFLLVPALIEMSPIGGIPGVPTLIALVIAIAAIQLVLGRDHLWMPSLLERRSIPEHRIQQMVEKLSGFASWLDRWFHGRLPVLTGEPIPRIAGLVVLVLCLTVPPLEVLPFASTVPMLAIAGFGLALLVRDGILMAFAFAASLGAFAFGIYLALSGGA